VTIHKLAATDAFVVFDLDGRPSGGERGADLRSVGPTRLAPKILVDGAELLARSATYLFASFEQQVGGASAGINSRPEGRDDAVAAFVAELKPLVEAGTFTTEAGRGLRPADLAPLTEAAATPLPVGERRGELVAAGVVAAAERVLGGLDGRTVAVEGWDQAPRAALAAALAERGASIVAVATGTTMVGAVGGLDPALLADPAWDPAGPGAEGAGEVQRAEMVWAVAADVVLAGSKAGVLDHTVADAVQARAVIPWGAVPVTAKALAALRRRDVAVLPDFVTLAGPSLVAVGGLPAAAGGPEVATAVTAVLDEILDHAQGPLLGACHRAEAYLRTWRDALPFGRPIA
jgi:hypothetical protein